MPYNYRKLTKNAMQLVIQYLNTDLGMLLSIVITNY